MNQDQRFLIEQVYLTIDESRKYDIEDYGSYFNLLLLAVVDLETKRSKFIRLNKCRKEKFQDANQWTDKIIHFVVHHKKESMDKKYYSFLNKLL